MKVTIALLGLSLLTGCMQPSTDASKEDCAVVAILGVIEFMRKNGMHEYRQHLFIPDEIFDKLYFSASGQVREKLFANSTQIEHMEVGDTVVNYKIENMGIEAAVVTVTLDRGNLSSIAITVRMTRSSGKWAPARMHVESIGA
jgi:hypothetical protein